MRSSKSSKLTMTMVMVILTVTCAWADVIPGRWEKVAGLAPGTRIIVEMQSGDRVQGAFVSITDDSLQVEIEPNNRTTLPKSGIVRILEEKRGKKLTVLGAGIGGAAGVATGLAISTAFDETFFARKDLMALTCGGIGALAGALIGNSIGGDDRQEVIFRSR